MFMMGMRIIEDHKMIKQCRYPKSKKRRIRKKWSKDPKNYKPSKEVALFGSHTMVCHPVVASMLRAKTSEALSRR